MVDYCTDIESKLKRIEEDPEGSGTSHLFNCIQGVSSQANRAFGSLFERQVSRFDICNISGVLSCRCNKVGINFINFKIILCRLKLRRSGLFKECFRGSVHYSICLVQSVGALARVNMIWQ